MKEYETILGTCDLTSLIDFAQDIKKEWINIKIESFMIKEKFCDVA